MPRAVVDAPAWIKSHLVGWPPLTQGLALDLLARYGAPDESTPDRLIWHSNAPWTRTVLLREGSAHNFPKPHQDVLEQTVSYRVPPEKVADLVAYDGSILVDRTRGELTVHCDTERSNILTLNIADDIVKGERSVEQALAYHAQVVRGVETGDTERYAQRLKFAPAAATKTADPAEEAPLLRHLGE
jgi:hypothetical protein